MSGKRPNKTVNELLMRLNERVGNFLLSRTAIMTGQNGLDPIGFNLDQECKYIEGCPTIEQFKLLYEQEGVATRIVSVLPDECWTVYPEMYETEEDRVTAFERAWNNLTKQHNPWHYLHRIDELSGIGQFGILLIGLSDGKSLETPAQGLNGRGEEIPIKGPPPELLYLRPFSQDYVTIDELETDFTNPRYGQPTSYRIRVVDTNNAANGSIIASAPSDLQELTVHWTRVLHVADNRKSSEVLGMPRLQNLHRRVFDIRKILGSAGEMFYKGGFPGISFETFPELTGEAELDTESVKDEIEAYSKGLQRYIRLIGMTAKSLAPQVAQPTAHLYENYQYICATLKCPLPVFLGHQSGHLAGEQDIIQWYRRLHGRQVLYVNPMVITPFARRLIALGILPKANEIIINWRDLNALSDKDKADVALKRSQAILQYITSGSSKVIRPKFFFVLVLGFTPIEADAIIKASGGEEAMVNDLEKVIKDMAGQIPGKASNPAKKTGAGGKRNGLG